MNILIPLIYLNALLWFYKELLKVDRISGGQCPCALGENNILILYFFFRQKSNHIMMRNNTSWG